MSVIGAFSVTLSGPYDARGALLEAFAAASIAAGYVASEVEGLDEESKGWVRTEFHEGTDAPSGEFMQAAVSRCTALGEQFGYELRSQGVTVAGAAQFQHVVDTRTGAVVMRGFNFPDDALHVISQEYGIPLERLELRDPPGLWDVPGS
ncbi:hypothetical protein AB8A21_09595 [Streptomyces sp. BF23-18]|uniref:hypothetical protein n=1 Tax=Streptomyces sp. BF23-18 TaxID=3240282 RepID=UPI0034E51298